MKERTTKYFTREEMDILSANEYVRFVSKTTIGFTDEFKRLFVKKHKMGMNSYEILRECGIDTDMLGPSRISSLRYRLVSLDEYIGGKRGQEQVKMPPKRDVETRIRLLENDIRVKTAELRRLREISGKNRSLYTDFRNKYK